MDNSRNLRGLNSTDSAKLWMRKMPNKSRKRLNFKMTVIGSARWMSAGLKTTSLLSSTQTTKRRPRTKILTFRSAIIWDQGGITKSLQSRMLFNILQITIAPNILATFLNWAIRQLLWIKWRTRKLITRNIRSIWSQKPSKKAFHLFKWKSLLNHPTSRS